MRGSWFAVLTLVLWLAGTASAEEKVVLSNVHLCCPSCVNTIEAAVKATGATATADKDAKKVTVVGKDKKEVQAALDAIGTAGYFGRSDKADLAMKPAAVGTGKVTSLEVSTHNCCAKCTHAIQEIGATAAGVKEVEATAKNPKITIKGEFDAAAAAKALNDGGFQVNK